MSVCGVSRKRIVASSNDMLLVICVLVFTVFCIVCTEIFLLFRLRIFILICFVCTSVRTAGPCGRSPAEIVGSNPTGDMDVCLL
jgi:hypothetical protein